jgi:hypothetical protein
MKTLRRVPETEVISEFLRNEFYQDEFHEDRAKFERQVMEPDLASESENALRRALLFRRRGHMWRELPADTQWFEVELEQKDVSLIRVFPRAQWRKVSDGSFQLTDIVQRIRTQRFTGKTRSFISKVQSLSYRLRYEQDNSCVLLIGIDEAKPMTILEGNHRLAALLLAAPELLPARFRVLTGFSPRMTESCWYETNLPNLWRYAKNRFRNIYDKDADVSRCPDITRNTALASSNGYEVPRRKIASGE